MILALLLLALGAAPAEAGGSVPYRPPAGQLDPVDPQADLQVHVSWDAPDVDVDLHVLEPSGEEVYYAHPRSAAGGRMARDVTDGNGPESYRIRRPPPGRYRIQLNYYGSPVDGPDATTRARVSIYRKRPGGRLSREDHFVVLRAYGERVDVTRILVR